MPTSIMQKNYSHCPLKKRPVLVVREEIVKEETCHDMDEPENLSTKPEDLSRTGNYPTIKYSPEPASPISPVSRSPSPPRRVPVVPSINIPTPVYNTLPPNYHLQSMKSESTGSWHSPTHSNEQLSYASPTNWHKSMSSATSPIYSNYLPYPGYPPTYHSDHYESLYHHQVSPTRSEQLSPYTQRDSSVSPPAFIPAMSSTMVLNGRNHRDSSLSPPILVQPYPIPADLRRASHNHNVIKSEHYSGIHHRYTPYQMGHHHHHPQHQIVMSVDHSSLSPTSSHVSLNSMVSSRRSLSPSSSASTPEDLTSNHSVSVLMEKSSSSANIQKIKKDNSEKLSRSSGAPRYQCNACGKSYSTYSGLTKHKQFHCPAAENNQEKKTFHCKDCDKVYVSLGALKMHIRTHTLPCKCKICGKAFSRPWLLQGHIRTHTGEKPFSCNHCNRAFADRSNLRAHLQTHSDVKKYSCSSCSKTFSRMSLLTKHSEGGCPGLQIPNGTNGFGAVNNEISVF